jgi:hypothetical protein
MAEVGPPAGRADTEAPDRVAPGRNKSQESGNKLLVGTRTPAYRYPVSSVTGSLSAPSPPRGREQGRGLYRAAGSYLRPNASSHRR